MSYSTNAGFLRSKIRLAEGVPRKIRDFVGKGGAAERVSVQDAARENSEACRRRDSNVRKGEKI